MIERKKLVNRLYEEWLKHGSVLIGCDFDDTIKPWGALSTQEDCDEVIGILQQACKLGARIVINTATTTDRYPSMLAYCKEKNLVVEPVFNKNPIELPYGNNGKIYANIFIDDRAGLAESLEILKEAMAMISKKHE